MNKKLISILIANLFIAAPAFAQDAMKFEGSLTAGGVRADDNNAKDASKLNEYRDLSDGLLLNFDLTGRSSNGYLNLFGENLGRDDHYIGLKGGQYGAFKYRLSSDQIKHNFLFGGRTPYTGLGSASATATLPALDPSVWTTVDSGYKRRDDGGFFEFNAGSPWYFRVDGNQVTTKGTKIGAASQGMSPGNGYLDLLFPTEYRTRNASVEGGYNTKKMHLSVSWMTSKFENDNESIAWRNGYFLGTDRTYLAPDNEYTRIAANATFRQLPLKSTLAVRFTKDELSSDAALGTTVLGAAGASLTTLPNVDSFVGRVENRTISASLASAPMKALDTRIYVNDSKREDKSSHVVFTGTASSGTPYENELFSYEKKNYGFDAFYRINRKNRVGVGYDYLDVERERFDFDRTKDKKWFAEWKTGFGDNLSARVKYQNLDRKSNFLLGNDGTGPQDVAYWNRFLQAYDAANLEQNQWKVSLDFTPAEFVDVSLEGLVKENKYKQMVLGRLKDDRREIYATVSYGNPDTARVSVFGDVESVKYDSRHRVVGASTAAGAYDPFVADTASNYNWQGTNKERNWAFGVALDLPATPKLMLKASVMLYKTDGSLDFAAPNVISAASYPQPVALFDDSKRTSFNLKGVYTLNKATSITAGYAYEKYDYADAQYDGYQYVIPAASNANSYLLGYYANPQYKANILYGYVTYRF